MEEKRQISSAEEFQIIYVDTLLSRRGSITPILSADCTKKLPSKESSDRKGEKSNFMVRKPDKPYLTPGDEGQQE